MTFTPQTTLLYYVFLCSSLYSSSLRYLAPNIRYVLVMSEMGGNAHYVTTREQLRHSVAQCLRQDRASLVNVVIDPLAQKKPQVRNIRKSVQIEVSSFFKYYITEDVMSFSNDFFLNKNGMNDKFVEFLLKRKILRLMSNKPSEKIGFVFCFVILSFLN